MCRGISVQTQDIKSAGVERGAIGNSSCLGILRLQTSIRHPPWVFLKDSIYVLNHMFFPVSISILSTLSMVSWIFKPLMESFLLLRVNSLQKFPLLCSQHYTLSTNPTHSLVSVLQQLPVSSALHPLHGLLQHEWVNDVTKSHVTSYTEELTVGEEKLAQMLWSFVGILKIIKQHIMKGEEEKSEARKTRL